MKKKLQLNEEQFCSLLMGIYDSAMLEYRKYTYDPWADIENNKIPKTYEKRIQYGDKLRDMCRIITKFAGLTTSYEGLETINNDYDETPENKMNYRSNGRTANTYHVISVHFPLNISSYGEEEENSDRLNRLNCIQYMLKRFKFKKLSEKKRGDEIIERYGISEYSTRHDKEFITRMESNNYEGYIKIFTLACNLHNEE